MGLKGEYDMIVKRKAYFLKNNIDTKKLEEFGFHTVNNESWHRDINEDYKISFYKDSRVFKKKISWRLDGNWTVKIKDHIQDLIKHNLVEIRNYYYYLCIFGRWQNWNDKKKKRIENKLQNLQEKENSKKERVKLWE